MFVITLAATWCMDLNVRHVLLIPPPQSSSSFSKSATSPHHKTNPAHRNRKNIYDILNIEKKDYKWKSISTNRKFVCICGNKNAVKGHFEWNLMCFWITNQTIYEFVTISICFRLNSVFCFVCLLVHLYTRTYIYNPFQVLTRLIENVLNSGFMNRNKKTEWKPK